MGMDESHRQWLTTNDDRESYESWECSVAEGYRTRIVKRETPDTVKKLVAEGKVVGDNMVVQADPNEDSDEEGESSPSEPVRIPREAPGYEKEIDDYHETSSDAQWEALGQELGAYTSDPESVLSDDDDDLGVQEDLTDEEIDDEELKKRRQKQDKQWAKQELHRKHRGTMNIKGLRHMKFLKDEMKVAVLKFSLVETEL
jgi:hypothetical protein